MTTSETTRQRPEAWANEIVGNDLRLVLRGLFEVRTDPRWHALTDLQRDFLAGLEVRITDELNGLEAVLDFPDFGDADTQGAEEALPSYMRGPGDRD